MQAEPSHPPHQARLTSELDPNNITSSYLGRYLPTQERTFCNRDTGRICRKKVSKIYLVTTNYVWAKSLILPRQLRKPVALQFSGASQSATRTLDSPWNQKLQLRMGGKGKERQDKWDRLHVPRVKPGRAYHQPPSPTTRPSQPLSCPSEHPRRKIPWRDYGSPHPMSSLSVPSELCPLATLHS